MLKISLQVPGDFTSEDAVRSTTDTSSFVLTSEIICMIGVPASSSGSGFSLEMSAFDALIQLPCKRVVSCKGNDISKYMNIRDNVLIVDKNPRRNSAANPLKLEP